MKYHVVFPCYSCHPVYSQTMRALIDLPELIQTHRFDDILHLHHKPSQANLFCFGCKDSKVDDDYATSHLWSRKQLSRQANHVKRCLPVGATLLDSDTNPITHVNSILYALSLVDVLLDQYNTSSIGADLEMHGNHVGQKLAEVFSVVEFVSTASFYVTCYKGREDFPTLEVLLYYFPDLVVNTMAYFLDVPQYRQLIEVYLELVPASQIFLGVSVKTTPPNVAVALVALAKEMKLGGYYVWNSAQDVALPKPGHAPNMKLFPMIQMLQQDSHPWQEVSQECPARLGEGKLDATTTHYFCQFYCS